MDTDLETLATALYVTADDLLKAHPEITPPRPRVGIAPAITDAEVLTLAAIAPLVGINTERRFLRYTRKHLTGMFPYIPGQSGYNKRLRALAGTPSGGWRPRWLPPPASTPTTCTWSTPPPSSAPAPGPPCDARTWPAGPATGTAPRTHASSGACACT